LFDHVARAEWGNKKSAETLIHNGREVAEYFGRNKPVAEIGMTDAHAMKAYFAGKGLAGSTVNRKVAALSKMLNAAADAGVIDRPPRLTWNQETQTRFRYLDDAEEATMLSYWSLYNDPVMHDFCVFLLDTGARAWSEAHPLPWSSIGPDDKSVTFWLTKTNKPRTVPLTPRVKEVLKRRRSAVGDKSGPFWGLNESTFRHRWDTMRSQLPGFDDVTPHTLRHTCCTRLVLGGADVKRVMTWMGHSSIQTTMRYMQIRANDLEGRADLLEARRA